MTLDGSAPDSARIADLKRRLAKEPASRSFMELAREYHVAGQFAEAAAVCAQGLRYHPNYISARVLLGRIYFDMGRTDESRAELESVLAQAPDNLIARKVLAGICLEQGDTEGALDRLRALLAFNPADAETRAKIAQIEARPREAQAAPSPPEGPPGGAEPPETGILATPTLAEIYMQQGLPSKAAEVYREILKGDPENAEARIRLAHLEKAAPAAPDPIESARRRKIQALGSWLEGIRRASRAAGRAGASRR